MQCLGTAQCPSKPSSLAQGASAEQQRPKLVHGCSKQGIPKDSVAILLCINLQGLFHFNSVSAQGSVSLWELNAVCLETAPQSQYMCY